MKRIILTVLRMLFRAPYYTIRFAQMAKDKTKTLEDRYFYIQKATRQAVKAARVTICTYGEENIPKKDGFVLFPNHQGMFDGLVLLATCPRPVAFVFKKEVENVVVVKQIVSALGCLPMDRKDIKQSMGVINEMTRRVTEGQNFFIFAEGTRSKLGNKLLNFKGGSFKSAIEAKCPIVPCALIDSFKPFDSNSIAPVTVRLIYLKPIEYEEYKDMKSPEIAKLVKERIEKAIETYA